jgi:hypothetical protein
MSISSSDTFTSFVATDIGVLSYCFEKTERFSCAASRSREKVGFKFLSGGDEGFSGDSMKSLEGFINDLARMQPAHNG